MRFPIEVHAPELQVTQHQREHVKLGVMAILVGILAATIAVLFRHLIIFMTENGFETVGNNLSALGPARFAVLPALGGLIVGLIIYYGAREAKGHGVPEVIDSVTRFGGRLRLRVIGVKAMASAITIGSGGSAGREGPIVHMGSAVGSNMAKMFSLTQAQTKILLGCGAAAGIAATFNTPIAGVLFAIELILMEFKTRSFIPLVIASVIATLWAPGFDAWLTGNWEGNPWEANPAFNVPHFAPIGSPWELVAYLGLGIICGLVALVYIKALYSTEDIFDRIRAKPWLKPALGGLILGVVGIAFPAVYGIGYEHVDKVLNIVEEPTFWMVVGFGIIAIVKIIGVSLTLGSGGSGGIFAPALFIGCMTGACFGSMLHARYSEVSVGAYALVGMAALVAASTRGTLTAIIMIFEMTRVYEVILPLLFACVIADMVASFGSPETIYTRKLIRRGVRIVHDLEPNVMQLFTVKDVMVPLEDVIPVGPEDQLHKVVSIIRRTGHNGFPVLDETGSLVGVVTHEDVRNAQHEGNLFLKTKELMTTDMVTVTPYETGEVALRKMGDRRISHLPVVDPYDGTKLMGWISKGDVVFAYEDYHRRMEAPFKKDGDEARSGTEGGSEPSEMAIVPKPFLHRLFRRNKERPAEITHVPTIGVSSDEEHPLEVGEVVDIERPRSL